ncbi:MAG: ATP-binding protein, partial [Desulfobacterales bacterium]|nr:ATP-binding protein [Desulfobacterales bacterium]
YQGDLWTVEVDKGQIEQVLINLYLNAWHAMANGGELSLQTANINLDRRFTAAFEAKPGRYVKISIADTGVGIGEAIRHRIFEPFFTTKEIGHGTGLGLASAYGIIRNHDGIIHFDSKVGQGTTFYIFLPASDKPVTTQTIRSANHNHHMLLEDKS